MKTIIKSLTAGILAAMVCVTVCATARAQTVPVNGWGLESDQNSGAPLVDTGNGSFNIAGPVTGNCEIRALLPTQISLVNVGDTITFSGTFIFTNASIGNQAFRIAILDTNGNSNVGTLSGGIWSHTTGGNPTNWLGYVVDLGTGGSPIVAGRAGGVVKDWDSTSGDFYDLSGSLTNGPNASAGTYFVTMSVQKVSTGFVNVSYLMTNSTGTYSNLVSLGSCYDDGSLVAGKIGPSTTKFNAVGFFQNGSVGGGLGPFIYTNITVTFANIPVTGWTNLVVDNFDPAGSGGYRYSAGQLIDVWTNWFGSAWVTNTWNSSSNASGGAIGSGSLQILANWTQGSQFFVYDHGNGINPPMPGLNLADFSCE